MKQQLLKTKDSIKYQHAIFFGQRSRNEDQPVGDYEIGLFEKK